MGEVCALQNNFKSFRKIITMNLGNNLLIHLATNIYTATTNSRLQTYTVFLNYVIWCAFSIMESNCGKR